MAIYSSNFILIAIIATFLWTVVDAANVNTTGSTDGPIGTHNSDPSVHCSKTRWYNVLFFYLSNYAIHAATVRSLPGESARASAAYKACCLLVPYAGFRRGLNVFMRASMLANTPLQMAARANALCMVSTSIEHMKMTDFHACVSEIKSETSNITNTRNTREIILHVRAPYAHYAPKSKWAQLGFFMLQSYRFRAISLDQQLIRVGDIQLHGLCQLPPGYTLCFVPPYMAIDPRHTASSIGSSMAISSQFSALQVLWSIAQTCIGSYTLYQSRGSQLEIYGYAAFGLTVIPYVIASIINLLASLVSRQYDNVFLVHSSIMDEAINRGAVVDGVVGSIDRVEGEGENITSDDELGKLGNSAVVFRGNINVEGRFSCKVDMTEDLTEYMLMPPEIPPCTPPAKIKKLKKYLLDIFEDPAKIDKRLASSIQAQKEEKCILSIPSHGSFTRLPPTHLEPIFLFLASLILIIAVAAPYIIIYILTGWQKRQVTSTQINFTIHWLCLGQSSGLFVAEFERHTRRSYWGWILLFVVVCYSWAPIGGLVVVAQEMYEFGHCESL
ncbi:hypothetical protein BHYA_0175g00270 [Botrytis hyacinthi]|uniref:Uncharacterized protein n=1 Tax=Botrytis hyacinthi TaxID=278943 RepID=A0A4Z1GDE3_9HELO|nr:hypothetical protein BHYA_0175g00270 [Botrytis hyacinthi]